MKFISFKKISDSFHCNYIKSILIIFTGILIFFNSCSNNPVISPEDQPGRRSPFKLIFRSIFIILVFFPNACNESLTDPSLSGYSLCYQKQVNGYWEIFNADISEKSSINISQYSDDDDEYPEWSPDGRYIVFTRSQKVGGPICIVYDTKNNSYTNLADDGGGVSTQPKWTPNNKIYFAYYKPIGSMLATYLMDPDGSNKIKILDFAAELFFYDDGYSFLYKNNSEVFKTNIENTTNEFILDCESGNGTYITIRDFNPVEKKFLVNTNILNENSSDIAEYAIEAKQLSLILAAEDSFKLYLQRYSNDYSQICFIENNQSLSEQYLSIFENGEKRRLLKLSGDESFDYNPMQFSPDNQSIAFSKNVNTSTYWYSWDSYLYVIEIYSGELHYIDVGINPSWNPQTNN